MSGPRFEAALLYEEARIRRTEGNTTGAFARYRRVLELADAAGDTGWRAAVMAELGEMYQEVFDLMEARRWYAGALPLLCEVGEELEAGTVRFRLGQVERLAGELDAAERLFDEALDGACRLGAASLEGRVRVARGLLLWERKRPDEGVPEVVRGYAGLREADPTAAHAAGRLIREVQGRVGTLRYQSLLRAAGAHADLLA